MTMSIQRITGFSGASCLVLQEAGKVVVVDPGYLSQAKSILKKYPKLNYIFLTHQHFDHYGASDYLRETTGAQTIAGQAPKGHKGGEMPLWRWIKPLFKAWQDNNYAIPLEKGLNGQKKKRPIIDQFLSESTFNNLLPTWQLIHTPGHTTDSYCLFHPKTRTLIGGDMFCNKKQGPRWGALISNKTDHERSKEKIIKLKPKTVYPGHGTPFDFPSHKNSL